jgi:hypothetical protein
VDNSYERWGRNNYIISIVNHKEEIEKQISNEIRILSIKPDSLKFNFTKIISKNVKVKPNLKLEFENQYSLKDEPYTIPDSIPVSGPKNILDTLRFVSTNIRVFTHLARTKEERASIHLKQGLKSEIKDVGLVIPVEQNTEVSFEVPIQILNKPADVTLKTFPGKVKVSCIIGLSKYKNLDYSTFHAFINFDKVSTNDPRLPVLFESLANVVISVSYSPKEVEYILEREK